MSGLLERLSAYGVSLAETMERFVDDEELYADCLAIFFSDEAFSALGQAIESGDHSKAFDSAHALKGVAANLGLTPLFEAICAIVEPLREGDYSRLPEQYKTVMSELERVMEICKPDVQI